MAAMNAIEVRPMGRTTRDITRPLGEIVAHHLEQYECDPLRTQLDAAQDSKLSVRSLQRYRDGQVPGPASARLLMEWLGLDHRQMRDAVRRQEEANGGE